MTDHMRVTSKGTTRGTPSRRLPSSSAPSSCSSGCWGSSPASRPTTTASPAAGHESHAKLLGIFQVSVLHNIVHLLFGAAGLALARTASSARAFLIGGGVVYLVLWLYGLVIDKTSQANFVPLNTADDWLHFVLGLGMIALGVVLGRRPGRRDVTR